MVPVTLRLATELALFDLFEVRMARRLSRR